MSKKIELWQLAMYVGTGLQVQFHGERIEPIYGITEKQVFIFGMGWLYLNEIKPLVCPLSHFAAIDYGYNTQVHFETEVLSKLCPSEVWLALIKEHADCFNWLEDGLAVNKLEAGR